MPVAMPAAQPQSQAVLHLVLDILLAPLVCCVVWWVRRRQSVICASGVALSPAQQALARAVGVADTRLVRVMAAHRVPLPLPHWACRAAQRIGWLSPHIAGMTLGYGIVLRSDCLGDGYCDARMLAHELTHVAQYERLGMHGFLRHYLRECVWPGYPHGPLEMEARRAEIRTEMRAEMQADTQSQTEGSTREADVIPYVAAVAE